jgi:hypothetical protein
MTSKVCLGCGRELPLTEFYRSARGYYQARCKPCNIAQNAAYRRANPTVGSEIGKRWRAKNKNTVKLKASQIREGMAARSNKKGFPPPEWTTKMVFDRLTENPYCDQTGIRFEFDQSKFSKSPWTPVPDRINPKLGYTLENVQWVCHMYNSMKQDYGPDEVALFFYAWSSF